MRTPPHQGWRRGTPVAYLKEPEEINNVVRRRDHDRGGHFAALEAPDLMLTEIRGFFADYR